MKITSVENKRIAAAVSGGADSMAMLDLLIKGGALVTAVNVEHGIRGEESLRDSAFVKEYCNMRGIAFLGFSVDAPKRAKEKGESEELAARALRYGIFEELLQSGKYDAVALAHHQGDQAETVLMRLLRGSGVRGLRGIVDRKGYIHPLLPFSKKEILAYCKENGVPFVVDSTNFDSAYTRNFIRNEVIPLIETRYPSLSSVLYKSALSFAETEDYLLSEITPNQREKNGVSIPLSVFERHKGIAKKSIAEAIREAGAEKDIEWSHLEAVYALKDNAVHSAVHLPFAIDAVKEYDRLLFTKREEKVIICEPFSLSKTYNGIDFEVYFTKADTVTRGVFDAGKIPVGAVVRTRKEGDLFKRFGGGTKPLAEYLTDVKVPMRERDKLLLIAKEETIYAVIGAVTEISEYIKTDQNTVNMYKINKREDN